MSAQGAQDDWQSVTQDAPAVSGSDPNSMLPLVQHLEGSADDAVSPAGAVGRYQIMPATAKAYGFDPAKLTDPAYNENVARTVLGDLGQKYDGDIQKTLVAYNAGPSRVNALAKANGNRTVLPNETQRYLTRAEQYLGYPLNQPAPAAAAAPQAPAINIAPPTSEAPAPPSSLLGRVGNTIATSFITPAYGQDTGAPANDGWQPVIQDAPRQNAAPDQWGSVLQDAPATAGQPPQDSWLSVGKHVLQNAIPAVESAFQRAVAGVGSILADADARDVDRYNAAHPDKPIGYDTTRMIASRADQANDLANKLQAQITANAPKVQGNIAKQWAYEGALGLVQMVPLMAASVITKSPVPVLVGFGAPAYAEQYENSIKAGRTQKQAHGDAIFSAAANALAAEIPLGAMMKPGQTFMGKAFTTAFGGMAANEMTEALQRGYDWGVLNAKMTWGEAVEAIDKAGIIGFGSGLVLGAGHGTAEMTANGVRRLVSRATPPPPPPPGGPSAGPPGPPGPSGEKSVPAMPSTDAMDAAYGGPPAAAAGEATEQAPGSETPPAATPGGAPKPKQPKFEPLNADSRAQIAQLTDGVPPEMVGAAQADVAEMNAAAPKGYSLFQAIKDLGGIMTRPKNEQGENVRSREGGEVEASLKDVPGLFTKSGEPGKRLGIINNETGMEPDKVREALQEKGWFGVGSATAKSGTWTGGEGEEHGDDIQDFYDLISKQAHGEPVYHPESETADQLQRRAMLDRDWAESSIGPRDHPDLAAAKLAYYRNQELRAQQMFDLRARADAMGVPHDSASKYDDLLADVLEREAMREDNDRSYLDEQEKALDDELAEHDPDPLGDAWDNDGSSRPPPEAPFDLGEMGGETGAGASEALPGEHGEGAESAAGLGRAPTSEEPSLKPGWGSKNTVVTSDDAAAARARLRAKLKFNPGQMNAGVDPTLLVDGMTLAGFHIEAGARAFADFARAMIEDLGEGVRPYLRSWYEAARHYPGMEEHARDMTPPEKITAAMAAKAGRENVPGGSTDLEPGGESGPAENATGPEPIPSEPGPAEPQPRPTREESEQAGGAFEGGHGVPDRGAATVGAPSNSEVQGAKSAAGVEPPGPGGLGGSDGSGDEGIRPNRIPAKTITDAAAEASHVTKSWHGDVPADIRAALPKLFPEQQEDVAFAERRFEKPDGHGVLFTNGTGTGKTFTGAGIIKRFVDRGKRDVLVAAPSQGILTHWVDALKKTGVDVRTLDSTSEPGRGVVATTYANLAQNKTLADRDFDLVVADESHSLMSQADGNETSALKAFRAATHQSPYAMRNKAWDRLRALTGPYERLQEQIAVARKANQSTAAMEERAHAMYAEIEPKVKALVEKLQAQPRPKAVFLSATPFAYDKNVDYGNGYLFNYGPEPTSRGYNTGSAKDQFFMQHFGYRMRYGKLTKPDNAVESDIMERGFHEWLRREGSLSGRVLNVDKDYDRKFHLVDDAVGNKIDQALDWLSQQSGDPLAQRLGSAIRKRFDYLARMRLLEALKATHAVDLIKTHQAMGRKVVVFHDYNEGGGFNPFAWGPDLVQEMGVEPAQALPAYQRFVEENPYVNELGPEMAAMRSPIETLTKAFPDALVYNGTVSKGQREKARNEFNMDAGPSGRHKNLIIVQSAAGQAGISLHDQTGKHMRVILNLGMPGRPTTAIQEEGRIYRIGQASDAPFRYMNTGTNWERYTFANRLAARAGTAENLALGEQARTLRDSFINAFNDSAEYAPGPGDGRGGKEADRRTAQDVTEFQRAKTYYFGQAKKSGRRDQREGLDYFATPEPLGLKMVEWADVRPGERILEPSAGHGAIARFFPETADRHLVEPSTELASKAALSSPGANVQQQRFEDLHIANKYDAIVMNPPFGAGGATAMQHLAKAMVHLRNGGRIVALIPEGPAADAKFEKLMYGEDPAAKGVYMVANIHLPAVTFERAGTAVRTRVVVLEKQTDPAAARGIQETERDYSDADNIKEFFNRIEDAGIKQRVKPEASEAAASPPAVANPSPPPSQGGTGFKAAETVHSKTGKNLYVATPTARVSREEYNRINGIAKKHGGYWSSFKGSGAIPGFQFPDTAKREAFMAEAKAPDPDVKFQRAPKDMFSTEPGAVDAQGNPLPQTIMPGAEATEAQRKAAMTDRQRAEMAARQQQSKLRRGGQEEPGGMFAEPDKQKTLFQRAPTFFSALTRGVEALKLTRAPASDWLGAIKNLAGVKQEERDWSGVEDWLRGQKGAVTKSEVLDHLRENEVRVQEVEKGTPKPSAPGTFRVEHRSSDGEWLVRDTRNNRIEGVYTDEAAARAGAERNDGYENAQTKFSTYTLPGGENYRELLMTLPRKPRPGTMTDAEAIAHVKELAGLPADQPVPAGMRTWFTDRVEELSGEKAAPSFQSSHFDEPNILAHVRFDDRRGPNGEKVLHVAEIQSDWHQKGRRQGYADPKAAAEYQAKADAAMQRAVAINAEMDTLAADRAVPGGNIKEEKRWLQLARERDDARREMEKNAAAARGGVPDAPFKSSWQELAAKRMLRYAAEHGYDRLSWDTGETQADRYDLSKQVDHIGWARRKDGTYDISVYGKNGERHEKDPMIVKDKQTPQQLAEIIGKDATDKIIAQKPEWESKTDPLHEAAGTLIGNDLKVGGEGMKGFYDKILPNFLSKYAKKWGAKVEDSTIGGAKGLGESKVVKDGAYWRVEKSDGERSQAFDSRADALAWQTKIGADDRSASVHSIPVTPAMRESVMEGQALFKRGGVSDEHPGEQRVASGLVGREANMADRLTPVIAEVARELNRIVPGIEQRVMATMRATDEHGGSVLGASFRRGTGQVIAWSLESPDAVRTARHEAVHALRQMGLIRPQEWSILTRAATAGDWINKYNIRRDWPGLTHEQALEEAIAEHFADWRRNPAEPLPNFIHLIYGKIAAAMEAMARAARRVLGMDATPDDILHAMDTGEIGRRGNVTSEGEPALQRAPRLTAAQRKAASEEAERRKAMPAKVISRFDNMLGGAPDHVGEVVTKTADRFFSQNLKDVGESVRKALDPMATGAPEAQAQAKDFANALRATDFEWARMDKFLTENFTPEQRQRMALALDLEGVEKRAGREAGQNGLAGLSKPERDVVEELNRRQEAAYRWARSVGIHDSEGLEFHFPRMVVGKDGQRVTRATTDQQRVGGNLTVTTGQMRQRKYEKIEDTEAAAKLAFGPDAHVVRDIRAVGVATNMLNRAIAGRKLVDGIEEAGKKAGVETISDDPSKANDPQWVHWDTPALTKWVPREYKADPETGKLRPLKDEDGRIIFKTVPIYVLKGWDGPLRAVLSHGDPLLWRSLMGLKAKAVGAIMYNPLVHNQVIFGKAFPSMVRHSGVLGALSFKMYRDGYKMRQDNALMQRALLSGMVPINSGYARADAGLVDQMRPLGEPPQGWTGKLVTKAAELMHEPWKEPTKEWLSKAHDFVANKLLWNRIADLQTGIWKAMSDHYVEQGYDQATADKVASYFANQYAGAVPREAISNLARGILNGILFSRSFHQTNIGGIKAVIGGMPSDIRAQITRDAGENVAKQAQGAVRAQAATNLFLDILSAYGFRILGATAVGFMLGKAINWPWQNEPGKTDKLQIGQEADGTNVYMNIPFGKYASEVTDWATEPLDYAKTIMFGPTRLLAEYWNNDMGFGRKAFDPYAKGIAGFGENLWRGMGNIAESVMPMGTINAFKNVWEAPTAQDRRAAESALAGVMTGFTVSHGAPGGAASGVLMNAREEHQFRVDEALPDIRKQIRRGDVQGARAAMTKLGMSRFDINSIVKATLNPSTRTAPRALKSFNKYATPEQRQQMQQQLQRH